MPQAIVTLRNDRRLHVANVASWLQNDGWLVSRGHVRRSCFTLPLGTKLKLKRFGVAISVLASGALVLSGCGSDKNATEGSAPAGPSAANVNCGGKPTLKASGSTAQANAMTRFVNAFEQACSGQTLNYTGNGSGAGISEFIGKQTDFGGSDSAAEQGRGWLGAAALRLAGVELAGGFRPDRGHLQVEHRQLAESGRPHVGKDFQRRHHQVE